MSSDDLLQQLATLYRDVDRESARLAAYHGDRLKCGRGCSQCCIDDLTVFTLEAENIVRNCADILVQEPGPVGGCAFLDGAGLCRIYAFRPYVCRTQGLPLRWIETSEEDDETYEYRDICPLNEEGEPLEELEEDLCWTLGPAEDQLAQLQIDSSETGPMRVPLRELFQRNA